MFSVDNFYDFFKSYYGWSKTKSIMWVFTPHGSKNLLDAYPYEDASLCVSLEQKLSWQTNGSIIMHDQEPFKLKYSADIYRDNIYQKKKHPMWQNITDEEIWLHKWETCAWPILCHSEVGNPDIEKLKKMGVIDCHYFYHGLISRDWYRHWKYHNDLLEKSKWSKKFLLYIRDCTSTRSYRKEIIKQLFPLRDQIQSSWGENQTNTIGSDFSAKIVIQDAVDTAIQIVSETLFMEHEVHLTEKVFKPMVMMQPFLLFAGAGSLSYLRDYGFQTFDGIWDESYDKEKSAYRRLKMLVELVNDLYRMPQSKFTDIINQCQEIVKHNQKHFFSEEFERILLKEMNFNVQSSIKQQKKLLQTDPGGSWFYTYDSLLQRNSPMNQNYKIQTIKLVQWFKDNSPDLYDKIRRRYSWVQNL